MNPEPFNSESTPLTTKLILRPMYDPNITWKVIWLLRSELQSCLISTWGRHQAQYLTLLEEIKQFLSYSLKLSNAAKTKKYAVLTRTLGLNVTRATVVQQKSLRERRPPSKWMSRQYFKNASYEYLLNSSPSFFLSNFETVSWQLRLEGELLAHDRVL